MDVYIFRISIVCIPFYTIYLPSIYLSILPSLILRTIFKNENKSSIIPVWFLILVAYLYVVFCFFVGVRRYYYRFPTFIGVATACNYTLPKASLLFDFHTSEIYSIIRSFCTEFSHIAYAGHWRHFSLGSGLQEFVFMDSVSSSRAFIILGHSFFKSSLSE